MMRVIETGFAGLKIIEPDVYEDRRGYFFESYNAQKYSDAGIDFNPLQDNESSSAKGVIRGLHYQAEPAAQAKLIRVIDGIIFDVAVDLREGSSTYGKWFGTELNSESKQQLFIPRGFAHGFSVLSDRATILYKCDQLYSPGHEHAIIYNDPSLGIDWRIKPGEEIISNKDLAALPFDKAMKNFKI